MSVGEVKFEIVDDQMAEILRRKTDIQRLRSVDAFWRSARAILRSAIVTEHPDWDAIRVNREISSRISNVAVDQALRLTASRRRRRISSVGHSPNSIE
jgi:hypothetical protein